MAYLHPELKERQILYLVKNKYCEINKKVGEIQVKTVDEKTAVRSKNYIIIRTMIKKTHFSVVTVDYPIEGVVFEIAVQDDGIIKAIVISEKSKQ